MRLYAKLPEAKPRHLYLMPVDRGVEEEVAQFLYGLVRMMKPLLCVETGTLVGDSAVAIATALKDNNRGYLHTCDIDIKPEAVERLKDLPATLHNCRGIELLARHGQMDFVHIDSGSAQVRQEELMTLDEKNISPGGIVAWHDAVYGYENMYNQFAPVRDWPHLVLPSVVGFAVFHRPE